MIFLSSVSLSHNILFGCQEIYYYYYYIDTTIFPYTLQEVPYVMVKEDKNLTGNARFEGFCIDLLHGIAKQIGFQYTIKLVPDRMYGVFDPETKQWNGIVRELIERVRFIVIFFLLF